MPVLGTFVQAELAFDIYGDGEKYLSGIDLDGDRPTENEYLKHSPITSYLERLQKPEREGR